MPIKPPDYQLKLALNLPEEEQVSGVLSEEQIRLRSQVARSALEGGHVWPGGKAPEWFEQYISLLGGGWDWRVAVYISWKAMPKGRRWPKTQEELATKVLGLASDRQISIWRGKNPAIDAMARDLGAGMVLEALGDVYQAMIEVASKPDYKGKGDRELLFKLAGMLADGEMTLKAGAGDVADILRNMPFDDLMRGAGITSPEKVAELRDRLAAELAAAVPTPAALPPEPEPAATQGELPEVSSDAE